MSKRLDVAYFTMEIGLKASIPTFAGGLGVLAADLMRSAADLKLNAACVTMCWQFGYLRQKLRNDGSQEYMDIAWNPDDELTLLPERVTVMVEGRSVAVGARVLELKSGSHSVPVYFLDTNLPENPQDLRDICKHLYGGDGRMRLMQEAVLGFGGVRMLRKLGYNDIKNFHLNEGHCAFVPLELLKERGFSDDADMAGRGMPASTAFATTLRHLPWRARKSSTILGASSKLAGVGVERRASSKVFRSVERMMQPPFQMRLTSGRSMFQLFALLASAIIA